MKPFHIEIPQAAIDDLHRRLADVRWPAPLGDDDWSRGVPVWYLRELVEYWRTQYDWRAAEAELNRYPQFLAEINGATVHFLHVRSPEPDAVPMLITHGWPGSVAEFVDVIGPLTDPAAHGGDRADAFHLVLASPPGFGFSGPARPGWHAGTIAPVWAELMNQLGYDQYVVQGGDAGSVISQQVAAVAPDHVIGLHVNMLMTFPSGDPEELAGLSEVDQARLALMGRFDAELSGYMKLQSTRPQTLAYALTDSPVGQLAWIVERFREWTDAAKVPDDAVSRDRLLTIVTIYWVTATAGTSAALYYEGAEGMRAMASGWRPEPIRVPAGVTVYPHDPFQPLRGLAHHYLADIVRWNEPDRGGHFAAMEEPDLFVDDVRAFGRLVR